MEETSISQSSENEKKLKNKSANESSNPTSNGESDALKTKPSIKRSSKSNVFFSSIGSDEASEERGREKSQREKRHSSFKNIVDDLVDTMKIPDKQMSKTQHSKKRVKKSLPRWPSGQVEIIVAKPTTSRKSVKSHSSKPSVSLLESKNISLRDDKSTVTRKILGIPSYDSVIPSEKERSILHTEEKKSLRKSVLISPEAHGQSDHEDFDRKELQWERSNPARGSDISLLSAGSETRVTRPRSLSTMSVTSAAQRHYKVMRRNYDVAPAPSAEPAPPKTTDKELQERDALPEGKARLLAEAKVKAAEAAEKAAEAAEKAAAAASAAAQELHKEVELLHHTLSDTNLSDELRGRLEQSFMPKISSTITEMDLALGDDDDAESLRLLRTAYMPGEWPPLTKGRRAFIMGRLYRTVYQGFWGPYKTPEGSGNMTRPFKVEYEGEFQDGMCHGPGELLYPNGAVVSGVWDRGHLNQPQYISHDGLNFHPDGPYCKMPDRRFYTEIQKGLRPAGRSQLTNQHPARPVPHGCYDAGDGIFDPRRNAICEPETLEVVRVPTTDEMDWIKQNCRKGWDENVGYRPDLYENWIYEPSVMSEESEVSREEEAMVEEEKGEEEEEEEEEKEDKGEEELSEKEKEEKKSLETLLSMETPVVVEYPPVAVQDVTIDIGPLTDVTDMLVPEMEITGESVKDKLMIPADKELVPENQRILARYLKMIEQSEEVKEEDKEIPGKEEPGESPPPTPRLDLDETDDVYKGAWRHVARRLLPLLRQRLEDDRHAAAAKWQEDLVQLLSERASTQGLEMSTSGFLGATASVSEPEGPMRKRGSSRIFPPGLEERARARRAEREEREREENAKRQAEVLAKERAKMEGRRMAEHGSSSSEGTEATEAGGSPRGSAKPSSVLPASTSMAVPKGGRESASSREGTEQMSRKKRSLMFKDNEEEID